MIGGYLDKPGEHNTTGPCYRAINIMRKTGYRDSDYSTRTRLIGPINAEILSILYSVHFLSNLVYPPTGIELSDPHTLPPLSKKLQIMHARKDDRTVAKDFIIQRKKTLNHVNVALLLKQPRNVDINMLKNSPATNFGILNVVEIENQTPLIIRTKCNIYSIIDRILTHQLLSNPVIHITKLSQVVSLICLSKMMVVYIEFEIYNISNTDVFPIRILNFILLSSAEHSINNYITLNFPCVQKLRGDNMSIVINFVSIV